MSEATAFPFDDQSVDNVPLPQGEQVEYRDTHPQAPPGFRLRVSYGGTKTYYVILRVRNRKQRKKIGSTDVLSVEEARAAAREVLAKTLENTDPAVADARATPYWSQAAQKIANDVVAWSAESTDAAREVQGREFFRSPEDIEKLMESIPAEKCPEAIQELQEAKRILEIARERLQKRLHRLLPVAKAVAGDEDLDAALAAFKAKYYASGKPKQR
jgi:hypothetical protein